MKTKEKPILRKISRGFQITLPPEFRQRTGLGVGDHVRVEQEQERLIITPVSTRREQLADQLAAALAEPVEGEEIANDEEAIRFAIEQVQHFRAERRKKSSPKT